MPQKFTFRRTVKHNRVRIDHATYRLSAPVPDGTPVMAIFPGDKHTGRPLERCGIYMAKPGTGWPYRAGQRIDAEYECHALDNALAA